MTQRTILLVEDNPHDELLTLRALHQANVAHRIEVMRDGQQALDYLFGQGEFAGKPATRLPIAVLLDIGLPKLSGLDVLGRVRAHPRTRLLPIVMFSSSDEERDRRSAYTLGCNSFVRKPVEFGRFAQALAGIAGYWLALNEPIC
jgi:CheY-like chemotaxis protein